VSREPVPARIMLANGIEAQQFSEQQLVEKQFIEGLLPLLLRLLVEADFSQRIFAYAASGPLLSGLGRCS
jgi:hypothetical protein